MAHYYAKKGWKVKSPVASSLAIHAHCCFCIALFGPSMIAPVPTNSQLQKRRVLCFQVALVCADTFRAGAFDQLKQNATKVRIRRLPPPRSLAGRLWYPDRPALAHRSPAWPNQAMAMPIGARRCGMWIGYDGVLSAGPSQESHPAA